MSSPDAPRPYGPQTAAIRRFLVQLAGLGASDRARIVTAYAAQGATRAWQRAEQRLAEAMVRGDRERYRDAVGGPLLPLVRRPDAALDAAIDTAPAMTDEEALAALDPVAEPAWAAVLTLVVWDLLDDGARRTLVAPFDGVIAVVA